MNLSHCFPQSGLTSFLVSTDTGTYPVSISVIVAGVSLRRSNNHKTLGHSEKEQDVGKVLANTLKAQVETHVSSKEGDGSTDVDTNKILLSQS